MAAIIWHPPRHRKGTKGTSERESKRGRECFVEDSELLTEFKQQEDHDIVGYRGGIRTPSWNGKRTPEIPWFPRDLLLRT